MRRAVGKVLEEVAAKNPVVVAPLLEQLPDLVEREARARSEFKNEFIRTFQGIIFAGI